MTIFFGMARRYELVFLFYRICVWTNSLSVLQLIVHISKLARFLQLNSIHVQSFRCRNLLLLVLDKHPMLLI